MASPVLYAVGDIHGDFDQLRMIHDRIASDIATHHVPHHEIIHIGDLVDRRFQSKQAIDYLIEGHNAGKPWVTLKGNHDRMFSLFLDSKSQDPIMRKDLTWLHPRLGGLTTLESYGITGFTHHEEDEIHTAAMANVPQSHRDFLAQLPISYDTPSAFFAHAGINPDLDLNAQVEDDLIWIRAPFHEHAGPHPKLIVHGHTPVDTVTRYPSNRINIDIGAAYGGPLSAIVLDHSGEWELTASGRAEIPLEA